MAMKPVSQVTYGRYTITEQGGPGTVINRAMGRKILTGIVTSTGRNWSTPRPHAFQKLVERGYYGVVYTKNNNYWQQGSGVQPYVLNYSGYMLPLDNACVNLALAKLLDKLRGTTDVSVDLVQWRQTLRMVSLHRRIISGIANHAQKLVPLLNRVDAANRDLVRTRKRKGRRTARLVSELNSAVNAVASARLEFVYGWKPTMATIYDLAKGVLLTDEPGLIRVEGKSTIVSFKSYSQNSIDAKVPIHFEVQTSSRCQVVAYYTPQKSVLDNLSKITSLNPLSILYEATPFSFVLDWAVGIGQWIRSLETAFFHRNDFVTGFKSTSVRNVVRASMSGINRQSENVWTSFNMSGDAVSTAFVRSLLASQPFPRGPVVQTSFGIDRTLNALALAKGVFLRGDQTISKFRR